jgi:hypothetical protein
LGPSSGILQNSCLLFCRYSCQLEIYIARFASGKVEVLLKCWTAVGQRWKQIVYDCFVIVSWRHSSVFKMFRNNLCDCTVKLLCLFWIPCALRISRTLHFLRYMLNSNDFWADHDCR